jgi:soluble lytic murein transglycosylase-like protein
MRCFRVASNLVGISVPIAAALFVCPGSASAISRHQATHRHSYQQAYAHRIHHVHYASRRFMPMQQNIFASAGTFTSENFAAPYATRRSSYGQTGYAQYGSQTRAARYGAYDNTSGMAATQASAAGLPASLVERVIRRESGGNARAVHGGNYGLMQIRLGTARAMGYTGSASGLLDPQTNMTYALRYLAGAYRAAGGNENRAIALYSRGYYNQAKAQGFSPYAL